MSDQLLHSPLSHWQPELKGDLVYARPLRESDYESLLAVASDPEIWAMHPEPDRYLPEKFIKFFQGGIECGGGLAVFDRATNRMIGSSRFMGHRPEQSTVEIGYTFYSKDCWGKGHNTELKNLMINHAFKLVDRIQFFVGEKNLRSRRAMTKLGGQIVAQTRRLQSGGQWAESVVFEIKKSDWELKN
jgi:RimJ/RimL family protein N-acetyltransferase